MSLGATLKYIVSQDQLDRCIEILSSPDVLVIAVDTEAAWWRLGKQNERMSLIQIAVEAENKTFVYVIDCFVSLNLNGLAEVLGRQAVLKVCHNAAYDVRKLSEHHGLLVKPVWCTLIAERRAGNKKGNKLAELAKKYLDIPLDKSEQLSEWGLRPLTRQQLVYAAADAVTTLRIYHKQIELKFNGDYGTTVLAPKLIEYKLFDTYEIIPGLEGMFTLSHLYEWLKNFISSGKAKAFQPDRFYTKQGIWVDDVELYAGYLQEWLSVIVGEEKSSQSDKKALIECSECVPTLPTDSDGKTILGEFYAFVMEGKRWIDVPRVMALEEIRREQEAEMKRYFRECNTIAHNEAQAAKAEYKPVKASKSELDEFDRCSRCKKKAREIFNYKDKWLCEPCSVGQANDSETRSGKAMF